MGHWDNLFPYLSLSPLTNDEGLRDVASHSAGERSEAKEKEVSCRCVNFTTVGKMTQRKRDVRLFMLCL